MQLAELKRQVEHVKQDRERQVEAISRELDQARERIMNLQRSESLVEVYKKKVENFEDLRQQLIDMLELNRKL
jgi:prefoldin subunit 5